MNSSMNLNCITYGLVLLIVICLLSEIMNNKFIYERFDNSKGNRIEFNKHCLSYDDNNVKLIPTNNAVTDKERFLLNSQHFIEPLTDNNKCLSYTEPSANVDSLSVAFLPKSDEKCISTSEKINIGESLYFDCNSSLDNDNAKCIMFAKSYGPSGSDDDIYYNETLIDPSYVVGKWL